MKILNVTAGIDDTTNYLCEVFNTTDHHSYWINTEDVSLRIKYIDIKTPIGGEEFIANDNYNITWESQNVENVKIEFSDNDGLDWTSIISGISTENNNYSWTIPELNSDNCFIRITDIDDGNNFNINDSSFQIKNDQIVDIKLEADLIWFDSDYDGVELGNVNASGSSVNFGNISKYIWTTNEDTIGIGNSSIVELPTGTNEVILSVTTNLGRTTYDTIYISVYSASLPTSGAIYSSVSQLNEKEFFIASSDDKIYKFDSTGVASWTILTGGSIQSTICISNEQNIYVGSEDTRLYVFNKFGTPNWDKAMGGVIVSSPSVGPDNNIYVGITSGRLISMNESGTILWSTQVGGSIVSSPSISNDNRIYFGSCDKKIYCLSNNGDIIASFETQDSVLSSPAIAADGTIYIGANDGYLYKLDRNLNLIWKYFTLGKVKSSPVIDENGNIFIGSSSGYLFALNEDKELLWKYNANIPINGNPTISLDGTIYIGDESGRLLAFSNDGFLRWELQLSESIVAAPLVTDKSMIYLSGIDGKVYIMRDPIYYSGNYMLESAHQWPTFKGNNKRTGFIWDGVTDVDAFSDLIPLTFDLMQNYPNPFNPSTKIKFGLPKESEVSVAIYNILGEKVNDLVNQHLKAGYHEVEFNNTSLSSGIYFYRIVAADYVETKKMILLK